MSKKTITAPRLPVSINRLGARRPQRTGPRSFSIAFAIDDSVDYDDPGYGSAIVDALRTKFTRATVKWNGAQADAIFITFA